MTSEFYRFVVSGGLAAIVNIASRKVFSLTFSFKISVVLAYLLGMLTAFILTRQFVFRKSHRNVANEATRFVIVNLIALAQVWIVSVGLAQFLFPIIGLTWHAEFIAHMIGVLSPIGTSYVGHKRFTFG